MGVIAMTACGTVTPQRGGHASTIINRGGQTNSVTLEQSENPKEPSTQLVHSEQTTEYVLPPGTAIQVGQGSPNSASQVALLEKPVPVRIVARDRTETRIGGAQKDTVREWASRAAAMQPVLRLHGAHTGKLYTPLTRHFAALRQRFVAFSAEVPRSATHPNTTMNMGSEIALLLFRCGRNPPVVIFRFCTSRLKHNLA